MNLGLFLMLMHPPDQERTRCFEEDLTLVVLADHLGYSDTWVGQRSLDPCRRVQKSTLTAPADHAIISRHFLKSRSNP